MLKWSDDVKFTIDDINFIIDITPGSKRRLSIDNSFTLVKTKSYIKDYMEMDGSFNNILELGLFQGGSLVFFDKIFKPQKMVGLDIMKDKISALENYIKSDARHIKTYYNSSQDDEYLLESIVRNDLDGQLDLVVDDASHLYELTKKSFTVLFPLLKAGGIYLIEDWAWSHRPNAQTGKHPWNKMPAMTNLIFEIITELGGGNEIEDIYINNNMLKIRKKQSSTPGSKVLKCNYLRDRELILI